MVSLYKLVKRFLVLILLIQLTFQSVFILEFDPAQAAAIKESSSKDDFYYSSLMRQVGELKEKDAAFSQSERAQVIQELASFIQSEKGRVKDLRLPYSRRRAYISLLEKQLDSLDTAPPGKIESIITTISSWFSSNQDEIKSEPTIQEPAQPSEFAFAPDDVSLTSTEVGKAAEAPAPEPIKSWWQRLWQKIKDLFNISPVQAEESGYLPTIADIQPDNAEVIINSDISDLAAELNYNPVKIFNYVRANITYEPYYGAKKGSVGCLIEKVCNDVDAASLVIALLRASGIPARYHKALAVAPVGALKELLGVDEVKTVYLALATNKIPVSLVAGENPSIGGFLDAANLESETQLALEWVVAELFYEYDERGGNIDNTVNLETLSTATTTLALQSYLSSYPKKQWFPAEVLIKNPLTHAKKEIVADTVSFDSQAFWYGFLQYQGALSPMQKYRSDLLSATSKDVFSVNYQSTKTRPITPDFDILPPGLPYQFTVGTDNTGLVITDERWSQLPDSRREQVIITLKKSSNESTVLSHAFFASEINNVPVSLIYDGATQTDKDAIASYGGLAYTPASLVAISPSFNLEGANYTTANAPSIGDSLILDFQYQVKGQTISQNQKFSIAGNEEGIYVAFGKIQSDPTLDDPNLTSAQRASRILIQGNAALAREYLKHYQQQNDLLKKSLDYEYQVQFSRAIITQNRILTPVGNTPTTFDFQGLTIDAATYISDYSNRGNYKTHRQPFRLISSLEASYYEAGLFKDIAGLDAVSTVTGLQYVYANPGTYNVQIITSTNESAIDSLDLTANTKANLHADVQAGKTIITPNKFVAQGVWSGILYISLSPDWTGMYAIGEQVQNGGFTSEGYEILNVLIDGKQYAQFINQNIGHPDNFIYTDQTANTADKLCRISKATFLDIMNNENWQESYGLPCLKEQYTFGTHDHTFIMALNASKFKSTADGYNYWEKNQTILSRFTLNYPDSSITMGKLYPYWGTYVYDNWKLRWEGDRKGVIIDLGIYNPQSHSVYAIPFNMRKKYISDELIQNEFVPNHLGYPKMPMTKAAITQRGKPGYYQQFTNGTMYWDAILSTLGDPASRDILPGKVYITYGIWDAKHNALGGTGGIGFPMTDVGFDFTYNGLVQKFDTSVCSLNAGNNTIDCQTRTLLQDIQSGYDKMMHATGMIFVGYNLYRNNKIIKDYQDFLGGIDGADNSYFTKHYYCELFHADEIRSLALDSVYATAICFIPRSIDYYRSQKSTVQSWLTNLIAENDQEFYFAQLLQDEIETQIEGARFTPTEWLGYLSVDIATLIIQPAAKISATAAKDIAIRLTARYSDVLISSRIGRNVMLKMMEVSIKDELAMKGGAIVTEEALELTAERGVLRGARDAALGKISRTVFVDGVTYIVDVPSDIASQLVGKWFKGTSRDVIENFAYHYQKHGVLELEKVGKPIVSQQQYLKDVAEFYLENQNRRVLTNITYKGNDGVIRTIENGGWNIEGTLLDPRGGTWVSDGTPIRFWYTPK